MSINFKVLPFFSYIIVFLLIANPSCSQPKLQVTETRKIYDNNSYCAFTGLIEFKDKYYCTFREASSHRIKYDDPSSWGRIVLLESKDTKDWKKVAEFKQDSTDFRDPKIKTTPDGKHLMLLYHSHRILKGKIGNPYSVVRIFDKTDDFNPKEERIKINGYEKNSFVLWNVTSFRNKLYGFICGSNFMLVCSSDGVNYDIVSDCSSWAKENQGMNESNIAFYGMNAYTIVRSSNDQGYWGESRYPFVKWNWQKMNISVGGPNLLMLNRRTIFLGSRDYGRDDNRGKTAIYAIGKNKKAEKVQMLESTSDSSYPCFLRVGDNKLMVSYYSGKANHSNIYIATLQINK